MLTPDDQKSAAVLKQHARMIRICGQRLERLHDMWRADAGLNAVEMYNLQITLGEARVALDALFAEFGKAGHPDACATCHGSGKVADIRCTACGGRGYR